MPIATFRTFLGVGKEATPGTPVAATDFFAITSDPKPKDTYKKLDDKSFRGSMVETYAKIAAMRTGEISIDGNVNTSTIGYLLGSVLPDVTTAALAAPTGLTGVAAAGGSFAAATYFWKVTALTGTGETVGSNEFTTAVTLNQKVTLSWTTVAGASSYNVYRGTVTNTENALIGSVGPVGSFVDTGTAGTAATVPATGSAATNGHSFACKNNTDGQPKSLTFTDFDGDQARAFSGGKISDLGFKFSADGLLTHTSKAMTWASTVVSTPSPSFSSALPIAAYTGVLLVGGSKVTNVQSADISIKRKVEYLQTVQGIQDPYAVFSGSVAVSGKLTTVLLASDPFLAQIGNSSPGDSLSIAFTSGTTSLVMQFSSVVYDSIDVTRGKDYVELAIAFTAVGNTTDVGATNGYSPMKVLVANNAASGTYQ